MKNKKLILLSIIIFISYFSIAQISKDKNSLRDGDYIKKKRVEYKDPGRSGESMLWDFSSLKTIDENYIVRYKQSKQHKTDSIPVSAIEHGTKYDYLIKNDSLFLTNIINTNTVLHYSPAILQLKYPFNLGDSVSSPFCAFGENDMKQRIQLKGTSTTVADATGTLLLPDQDTVRNAIRTKTSIKYRQYTQNITVSSKDTTFDLQSDTLERIDTLILCTDIYRWYAKGYRYPVFETQINKTHLTNDTLAHPDITTAFYTSRKNHKYLIDDKVNSAILDSINNAPKDRVETSDIKYKLYPTLVKNLLNIDLHLKNTSNISINISDSQGHTTYTLNARNNPNDLYRNTLDMSNYKQGVYIIKVSVNGAIIFEDKIIKTNYN